MRLIALLAAALMSAGAYAQMPNLDMGPLTASTTSSGLPTASLTANPSVIFPGGGSDPTVGLLPTPRDAWPNWKVAGLQSLGGIPNRTNICNPGGLSPSGGDDTANIQNAINSCSTPCPTYASTSACVILLNPGTFTLSSNSSININKSVVVRGSGAGITIVDRTNGAIPGMLTSPTFTNFRMGGGFSGMSATTALTSDAATDANGHFVQGTFTVNVASTSGITVGSLVNLDELGIGQAMPDCCFNNGTGQVWASPDYRYEWNAHNPPVAGNFDSACFDNSNFTNGGNCAAGGNHSDATAYSIRPGGVTEEYHLVSAINGNTLTFDSPITINYRVANSASIEVFNPSNLVSFAGLENLTLSRGGDGGVQLQGCVYCWVRNVENYHYFNPGIHFEQGAFRDQLTGSWLHNGAWPVNGGGGYSIALTYGPSEILIDNNISMLANKVIVMRASGAGAVVAYNYMDDSYISGSPGWVETGLNNSHLIGSHHALFEGNVSDNIDADFTHGATSYLTAFDNWITGIRATFTGEFDGTLRNDASGCCSPRRALASHPYTYRQSFIDNIAGLSGVTTTGNGWVYSDNGGAGGQSGASSMFKLGWNDVNSAGTNKDDVANVIYPADPRTLCPGTPNCSGTWVTANGCMSDSTNPCTTVVAGNYDYVTGTVTNPVSQPASFYLLATPPPFWDGHAFPPFNPVGPVLNDIPAHRLWLSCQPNPTASCIFPSGPPTISGVTISGGNNFSTPVSSGITIDTLTANCSTGSCSAATLSLPSSAVTGCTSGQIANNGSFAISGSNLNAGGSTVNAGTYNIGIQVALSGATNTPQCYPFTLTGTNPPPTAWDGTHKSGNVTLSGSPTEVATQTAGSNGDSPGYGNNSHSGSKFAFAVTINALGGAGNIGIGVGTASAPITSGSYCGVDNNDICLFSNGTIHSSNSQTGTSPTFTTGNKVWIAVDLTNKLLWITVNSSPPGTSGWIGAGNAAGNPDTDTNGISLSGLASGALFPGYNLFTINDQITADFTTASGLSTYSTW